MTGGDGSFDGRVSYRNPGGAPKPSRWKELVAAHIAGDSNLVAAIEAEYHAGECGEDHTAMRRWER